MLYQAQRLLSRHFGLSLMRDRNLYPWQVRSSDAMSPTGATDVTASDDLRPDNPRLLELIDRYARCDADVTGGSVWHPDKIDGSVLRSFRGDNPYVFQQRMLSGNELAYALTYYQALRTDAGPILERLSEDGAFGAFVIELDGRLVTRDLLDSASELAFLHRHVGLGERATTLLDVGAGYGRLPFRAGEAFPGLTTYATDAFPASTFLSEYYLAYRKSAARVLPLDEVTTALASIGADVATNIHSFSECKPAAIHWWAARLASAGVRHLMVVPNKTAPDGRCLTNDGTDMEAIFAEHDYRPTVREPRYAEPIVRRWGVDPAMMVLFERR